MAAATTLCCPSSLLMITIGTISVFIGKFPAMKTTEPYSPSPRAKAMAKPASSAGNIIGRITRKNVWSRLAPRLAAASSTSGSSSSRAGWSVRTTNGSPMNTSATVMPSCVSTTSIPKGSKPTAQPAGLVKQDGQRDSRDRGRQGERQVDDRVDHPLAGKGVPDQDPGHDQPEHGVDRRGHQRRPEAQAERGHDLRGVTAAQNRSQSTRADRKNRAASGIRITRPR